jgi:glycosyltransferase involved in cell wall biosynthesis
VNAIRRRVARAQARAAWGIGEHEFVIGHVGRFDPLKNHAFLVKAAAEVVQRRPDSRLLLVGDGPLRGEILDQARELGIADRVIFTGTRDDVPNQLSAMDVFVFPSISEGLGLAVVEAQAAGLPCVISSAVPAEADILPQLILRASSGASPSLWADLIFDACRKRAPGGTESLAALENSVLNLDRSIESLYELWGGR